MGFSVADEIFFYLYICGTKDGGQTQILWEDLPTVLCMDFAHRFMHDGFLPNVFCRLGKGSMVML